MENSALKIAEQKPAGRNILDFFHEGDHREAAHTMADVTAFLEEHFCKTKPGEQMEVSSRSVDGICFLLRVIDEGIRELSKDL